ncbi:uncharacterized protein MELLADRAFT_105113 [Melampsora larici-populina 98AG31]|uniref:Uncharacterized protein n=1 Tax=Melampsora larici-populina (strain 98AG31 / pathotype 3-4-7) TaxID=747676 RepID=F4RHG4_MELLP|nr:uncharacterized protein MELLADRAFT_105113 [Melampsora larici-populina 98AG31]EGG08166.1 hypothetical protein MELLADRAFT_105113 [Melampsora larici-populina 98AG31]
MDILDPFLYEIALNHPGKPWSSCKSTRDDIIAFVSQRSCEEELRRLGRKVRQLMLWALDYQGRIDAARPNLANDVRAAEWNSIYTGLTKTACRPWRQWNCGLLDALKSTLKYVHQSADFDRILVVQWPEMVVRTNCTWADIQPVPIFWEPDSGDEEEFPQMEEEIENELDRDFFGLLIS